MNNGFINWAETARLSATAEAGGDFILPNDLPDVKRTVHVLTRIKKADSRIDDAAVSADGELTFMIMYCGDDGRLHFVSYDCGVTAKAKLRDTEKAEICEAVFGLPDTAVRLSNPRKFSIKCRIPVTFVTYAEEEIAPYINGTQDKNLQYDEREDVACSVTEFSENDIPYAEDIQIPENYPEPDRQIASYVIPGIPAATPSDGSVEIAFPAEVMIVYLTEDSIPVAYKTVVNVVHSMENDTVRPDSVCRASVVLGDCRCSLTTDRTGALRIIELDITYSVDVICDTPEKITFIRDMYSTEKESVIQFRDVTLRHVGIPYTTHFTVSSDGMAEPGERAVAATAEIDAVTVTQSGGQSICEGTVSVYTIVEKNGEYESKTVAVPVRTVLPYTVSHDCESTVTVKAGIPTVRYDGGRSYTDTELYLCIRSVRKTAAQTVRSFEISDTPIQKRKASLLICRPNGATMWETAKKYKVPIKELEEENKDVPASVRIIPC